MSAKKPAARARNFRSGIWYTLLCSILSIFLIFKLSPGFSLRLSLTQIHWGYIFFGLPVLFLVWFSKAYRMFAIARGMGIAVDLKSFLKIYLATCFISHITPFSSGGTPLQIYLISKQGVPLGKATAITAVDLGLHSAFFILLIPLAFLLNMQLLRNRFFSADGFKAGLGWSLLLLLILLGSVSLLRGRGRSLPFLVRIGQLKWVRRIWLVVMQNKWLKNLHREWELFREGWFTLVRHNPASIGWAFLATLVYWLFYFLLAPIIIWSLGRPASFWALISRQLFYNFGQILVPTPGGSGGSELLLTYLFKSITGASLIGPFVFFWKLYTFYCTLLLGGYYFFKLTRGELESKEV